MTLRRFGAVPDAGLGVASRNDLAAVGPVGPAATLCIHFKDVGPQEVFLSKECRFLNRWLNRGL